MVMMGAAFREIFGDPWSLSVVTYHFEIWIEENEVLLFFHAFSFFFFFIQIKFQMQVPIY